MLRGLAYCHQKALNPNAIIDPIEDQVSAEEMIRRAAEMEEIGHRNCVWVVAYILGHFAVAYLFVLFIQILFWLGLRFD
jgi:hypothetical protein